MFYNPKFFNFLNNFIIPYGFVAFYYLQKRKKITVSKWVYLAPAIFLFCLMVARNVFIEILPWLFLYCINLVVYRKEGFSWFQTGFLASMNLLLITYIYELPEEMLRMTTYLSHGYINYDVLRRLVLPRMLVPLFFINQMQKPNGKTVYLYLTLILLFLGWLLWIPYWLKIPLFPYKYYIRLLPSASFMVYPLAFEPCRGNA